MDDQIIESLKGILSPMGEEKAARVLLWMQQEATERALVAYCWDGGSGIFELGKPSPINPDVIVFAMLHWEQPNCIVVFGIETHEVEGKGTMAQYHRNLVFAPKHVAGPLSADALYNEIASFMAPEDDKAGNGAAEPEDEEEEEEGEARQ